MLLTYLIDQAVDRFELIVACSGSNTSNSQPLSVEADENNRERNDQTPDDGAENCLRNTHGVLLTSISDARYRERRGDLRVVT